MDVKAEKPTARPESRLEHHYQCPMCGFMVDEFVMADVLEHVRHHRLVPWRAWWRAPRRAFHAALRSRE